MEFFQNHICNLLARMIVIGLYLGKYLSLQP